MPKALLLVLIVLTPVTGVLGQTGDLYLSRTRPPVQISMMGMYQRYVDGQPLAQASFPILVVVPLSPGFGVSLQTSPAAAAGQDLSGLGGLSDARIAFSYYHRVGAASVGLNLGLNLPSGKRQLSADEFRTSVLLSQHAYGFRVPVLGQGFNAAPGLTFAVPLSDRVVAGAGFAYQYRGSFEPLDDARTYDPGDELVFTGGLDAAVTDSWTLTGDASLAVYQTDRLEDEDRYRSGNKIVVTAQLLHQADLNQLRMLVRYRTRARGELPAAGGLTTEEARTVPDQALARLSYRLQSSAASAMTLLVQGRRFSETAAFSSAALVDLGVLPEYEVAQGWRVVSRFVYTLGDFSGFEAGVGISAEL